MGEISQNYAPNVIGAWNRTQKNMKRTPQYRAARHYHKKNIYLTLKLFRTPYECRSLIRTELKLVHRILDRINGE